MTPEFVAARRELAWKSAGVFGLAGCPMIVLTTVQPGFPSYSLGLLALGLGAVAVVALVGVLFALGPFVGQLPLNRVWFLRTLPLQLPGSVAMARLAGSAWMFPVAFAGFLALYGGGYALLSLLYAKVPADSPLRRDEVTA
ncbi:MAG: hypothetical protein BGO01_00425 [Armatimonadetes bacterium 55-13]|nr:hypothetical protein [Armatimonadota bacterium]ODU52373.1 MAG: hypothetical protein ABT09_02740 [bacterium SCN 57-13]OJU63164.1 MAG: hypothetical protein BGO01_00425 [Armatimonadetes bacterium 55-13]